MREIIIDGEKIHSKKELHRELAEKLDFPEWYGANLDALHDCLTDLRDDVRISVVDFEELNKNVPIYGRLAVRVLRHAAKENGHIFLTVDWDDPDDDEEDE